jgi:hypothetical protein
LTEYWDDVGPRYHGLKGWFWHVPLHSPSCEYMWAYVIFGMIALDAARSLLDASW